MGERQTEDLKVACSIHARGVHTVRVAQLDRVSDYGSGGFRFESWLGHYILASGSSVLAGATSPSVLRRAQFSASAGSGQRRKRPAPEAASAGRHGRRKARPTAAWDPRPAVVAAFVAAFAPLVLADRAGMVPPATCCTASACSAGASALSAGTCRWGPSTCTSPSPCCGGRGGPAYFVLTQQNLVGRE